MPVHCRPAADLEQPAGVFVEPARAARGHRERRRKAEEMPLAIDLDEDALPVRAKESEIRMRRREETIDADVTLGDHRVEYPTHPLRRGERGFVGLQPIARS